MTDYKHENQFWRLCFNKETGALIGLLDRKRDIDYIKGKAFEAFRLETSEGMHLHAETFTVVVSSEQADLTWNILKGLTLYVSIKLASEEVRFEIHIENNTDLVLKTLEYPIISGIGKLSKDDALAHSYATGMLFKNPFNRFTDHHEGLRYCPYPESFSGASMQFFCYYGDQGGLLFMTQDAEGHQKWLNTFKHRGYLEFTHIYGDEAHLTKQNLTVPYPVVWRGFDGDWMDAANHYKDWAKHQTFCPSPLAERPHAEWLYQDIGLSTFGINAKHDRTLWLSQYHLDIQSPIFHILGPDWTNKPQTFGLVVPAGLAEWLPSQFNQDNLAIIRQQGDRFAPFEFDFLFNPKGLDNEILTKHKQQFPTQPKSHDPYKFNMLCPATEFTKSFHRDRDVQLLKEAGVDAMYYDISANNLIHTCLADHHDHPVGGGIALTQGYNTVYKDTKEAMAVTAGKTVPIGTEMMNEMYLSIIDYYQARAWAQPSSTLETWPFRHHILEGSATMIPMFSYVYHEYGALRLDGWGKLVEEIGTLFFHTVAKTYLWGGLYEINHEYSPMESINKIENRAEEHYVQFASRDYPYAPQRARYIRMFAALRTSVGNPYLAYGIMIKPLSFMNPRIEKSWFHYNHTPSVASYEDHGFTNVEAIVHSAYVRQGDTNDKAYFFANVDVIDHTIEISIENITEHTEQIIMYNDFDPIHRAQSTKLTQLEPGKIQMVTLHLKAMRVVMVTQKK